MTRSVLLLVAGAVTGGAAVWLLGGSSAPGSASGLPDLPGSIPPPLPAATSSDSASVSSEGYASRRIAIYEQAVQVNDAAEIETLLDLALDEPASRLRELKLGALLARYAELDPRAAVNFARTRLLDPEFLPPLFESWAQSDPDAAIAELALVTPPARQRELALAVLRGIGYDDEAIERVAAALPATSRANFEIDGWLARAELNPAGALRELMAMPTLRRSQLLPRVAELVATSDPAGALAWASAIDDYAERRRFRDVVASAWARNDPEAVFTWLESAEIMDLPESGAVYSALAAVDPDRVFELIDGLPPAIRANAERSAMQTIAETDATAALARLESMPPGQARDQVLSTIAQTYGRQNPDLALAWARNLPPPQAQTALRSVMMGIANVDPDRAFDLVLANLESGNVNAASPLASITMSSDLSLLMSMSMISNRPGMDFTRIADRLLTIQNPTVRSMLSSTIGNWSRQDPDAALNWAIANSARLEPSAFAQMAQGVAQSDQAQALAMIDRVPPDQRPQWVSGLAGQLAQSNPTAAMGLIDRFRGQPEYASVYGRVAQTMARTDPVAAAALLREMPAGTSGETLSAVFSVAREWSNRDPAAAADWAGTLGDQNMRNQALRQVSTSWFEREPDAAEAWVMGMSRGADRDAALNGYVQAASARGRFDPQILDAFSTEAAGQQAAASAIMQIGRTNQQEARRLLNTHITDERLRRSIEDNLARTGGISSGSFVAPPIVIRQ